MLAAQSLPRSAATAASSSSSVHVTVGILAVHSITVLLVRNDVYNLSTSLLKENCPRMLSSHPGHQLNPLCTPVSLTAHMHHFRVRISVQLTGLGNVQNAIKDRAVKRFLTVILLLLLPLGHFTHRHQRGPHSHQLLMRITPPVFLLS
jgi:hypothetical protein